MNHKTDYVTLNEGSENSINTAANLYNPISLDLEEPEVSPNSSEYLTHFQICNDNIVTWQ